MRSVQIGMPEYEKTAKTPNIIPAGERLIFGSHFKVIELEVFPKEIETIFTFKMTSKISSGYPTFFHI